MPEERRDLGPGGDGAPARLVNGTNYEGKGWERNRPVQEPYIPTNEAELRRLRKELDAAYTRIDGLRYSLARVKKVNYEQANRITDLEERLDNCIEGGGYA